MFTNNQNQIVPFPTPTDKDAPFPVTTAPPAKKLSEKELLEIKRDPEKFIRYLEEQEKSQKGQDEQEKAKFLEEMSSLSTDNFIDSTIEKVYSTNLTSTGFPLFDNMIGGGIKAGIYIIGGVSSIGKTSFMQQMAENLAGNGEIVFYFSLESSREQMILKSLTRTMYNIVLEEKLDPIHAVSTGILSNRKGLLGLGEIENEVLNKSKTRQKESLNSKNLYYYDSSFVNVTDILKKVRKCVEYKEKIPVVIVDYLQQLVPIDNRVAEYLALNEDMRYFRTMVSKYNCPILILSSLNRTNYKKAEITETSFKGSGNIEYGADVLISMQFNALANSIGEEESSLLKEKRKLYRLIDVSILKSRYGKVGQTLVMSYDAYHNVFTEKEMKHNTDSEDDIPFTEEDYKSLNHRDTEEEIMLKGEQLALEVFGNSSKFPKKQKKKKIWEA